MLLAALTLVPAIVTLLGRARVLAVQGPSAAGPGAAGFAALGRLVARRPAAGARGVAVALLGGLGAGVRRSPPTTTRSASCRPKTEATQAFKDLKLGFPAGALQPTEVYLTADRPLTPAEIGAFVARLAGVQGVASPLPPRVAADGRTVDVP